MLFRAEALSHAQQDQTEGTVLLRSPRILWACSLTALTATVAICCLLATARHLPQLRVQGSVETGRSAQFLIPPHAGAHLQRGQRIAVRYLAHPDKQKRQGYGIVSSLALAAPEGTRMTLAHDPGLAPELPPGSSIEADIPLPSIRLVDWIANSLTAGRGQP